MPRDGLSGAGHAHRPWQRRTRQRPRYGLDFRVRAARRSAIDAAHTVSSRRLCCRHECGGGPSLFRNWGFSAEFARTVVNVRLQPCTPCLSEATDAAAPAAWQSSPRYAARASADLVAERCDAATRPEWGAKMG